MIRSLALVAAASIGLAGCAMNTGAGMSAGMMTPTAGPAYVQMAASSDMYEIESSRLALQRSQRADVRAFANMMITHHTQTTQQLSAAANATGVNVPMAMVPMHAQLVAALRASGSAGAFDRLYVNQQVMAHQQALALHGNYAARGDAPALRQVAAGAAPIVQQHLQQAQSMPR